MTSPILASLSDAVTKQTTVDASAVALINGISDRLAAAVAAALANGASEAELAPVQAEVDALNAGADALSAAVTANTPAA